MPSLLLRRLGSLLVAVAVLTTSAGQGLAVRHCAAMQAPDGGAMAEMPGMGDHAGVPPTDASKGPSQAPTPAPHQCCNGMPGCCTVAPLAVTSQVHLLLASSAPVAETIIPSTSAIPRGPEPHRHSYPTGPPTALTV